MIKLKPKMTPAMAKNMTPAQMEKAMEKKEYAGAAKKGAKKC